MKQLTPGPDCEHASEIPTLFSPYLDDLEQVFRERHDLHDSPGLPVQRVPVLLYADDLALFARFESRREQSSFSLKSPGRLCTCSPLSGFLWNGTGENLKQFSYLSFSCNLSGGVASGAGPAARIRC